ncbi:MAG: hypothetical protein ACXAD7_07685, partial [Candidatus Kariarchaeaceae archaeon]
MKTTFLFICLLFFFPLIHQIGEIERTPSGLKTCQSPNPLILSTLAPHLNLVTETELIHSSHVNDTFRIYINLPQDYNPNDSRRYP